MISLLLGLLAAAYEPAAAPPPPLIIATPAPRVEAPLHQRPPESKPPPHRASANLLELFSTDDYPQAALRNEEQGVVSFTVAIDRDGRVTKCTVTTSSGSASLDQSTCAVIQSRSRFRPARDASGRRVEDSASGNIRWQLPEAEPVPFTDEKLAIIFTVDAAGDIKNCRTEGKANSQRLDMCGPMLAVGKKFIAAGSRFKFNSRELVFEEGLLIGGPESALGVGRTGGRSLILLAAVAMDIDATGSVSRCIAADGNTDGERANRLCEDSNRGEFVPLDPAASDQSERHAVRYQASYTRPTR